MGLLTRALTGGASGGTSVGSSEGAELGGILGNFMKKKKSKAGESEETGKASPLGFKRGGKVRKTGLAKVHKGERVLTKRQAKSHRKMCGK